MWIKLGETLSSKLAPKKVFQSEGMGNKWNIVSKEVGNKGNSKYVGEYKTLNISLKYE